jgi:hypothetical protein
MINQRLSRFQPVLVAYYEKENYVAYYQCNWLRLMFISVRLIQEAYQLPWWRAVYGAYCIARAEIAFAPKLNNLPRTRAFIRKFYILLRRYYQLSFDLDLAVEQELRWWIVHRELFASDDNEGLVDALADLLVTVYGIEPQPARESAVHRAQGMLFSDRWVRSGQDLHSPLLIQEEESLRHGYEILQTCLIQQVATISRPAGQAGQV